MDWLTDSISRSHNEHFYEKLFFLVEGQFCRLYLETVW